jgi:hypothetical protein
MNYSSIYQKLISNALNRILPPSQYVEIHHILPRCLGGTNDKTNLVSLTPEEHYLAHLLLVKIHPDNKKLIYASHMMTVNSSTTNRNNKSYGFLRRQLSDQSKGKNNHMFGKKHSEERKKKSSMPGETNPFYGKSHSSETKEKISKANKGKPGLKGKHNGMYGKNHTDESKKKISDNNPFKGKTGSDHPSYGRKHSEETKNLLSSKFKGKKMPQEFIDKISKSKGKQALVICPHCNKEGGVSNMMRYHFDKCKRKNT